MAAPMRKVLTWSYLRYFHRVSKEKTTQNFLLYHKYNNQFRGYSSEGLQNSKSSNYCVDLVNKCDYENFLCTLLLREEIRHSAFALRAFNIELAQIRDATTDKQRGEGRMHFWKDTLDKIYKDSPPQHPVALELHKAVKKHKLSKVWLSRIVDERLRHLKADAFTTVVEMEDYGEKTVASLLYLLLEASEIKDVHADHAASHIGRAQGIITFLRGMPYNTSKGLIYLPRDLMIKHSVSDMDVYRGKKTDEVSEIVYSLACVAKQHIDVARSFKKDVPKKAFPVFLITVPCDRYLSEIEKARFDVFSPVLQQKNKLLPLQLWFRNRRKTY